MPESTTLTERDVIRSLDDTERVAPGWGELAWLVGAEHMPGAEQTFGVVTIPSGNRNPLHRHPNCEELLYVLSGECDHKLGDEMFHLTPGTVIRIPRGIPHWARCTTDEPLVAVISFSSAERLTENLDESGDIA